MRIHFANQYGEVYAVASSVKLENGRLVPDTLLPILDVPAESDVSRYSDECDDDCGWCRNPCH